VDSVVSSKSTGQIDGIAFLRHSRDRRSTGKKDRKDETFKILEGIASIQQQQSKQVSFMQQAILIFKKEFPNLSVSDSLKIKMLFRSDASAELFVSLEPEERFVFVTEHFQKEEKVSDTTATLKEVTATPKEKTDENREFVSSEIGNKNVYESDENESEKETWGG
jgi:hypothetical protein